MSKILIVDDDSYLRNLYAQVFKESGFTVFEGQDGQAGLESAVKNKPDVIFTGIMMPRLTGFELIKKLQSDSALKTIPVVISSHLGRDSDRQEATKLGVKAFLVKGFVSPSQVVSVILKILGETVGNQKVYRLAVDSSKLDAKKLKNELRLSGSMVIELTSVLSGLANDFHATISSDAAGEGSERKDSDTSPKGYEEVLGEIEKKLEE